MKKFFHKVLPLVILSVVFAFTFALCSCTPTENTPPPVTYYSVTYSGTDLEAAQLAEGATIEKPENPTKSGQVFVGWYTDDSYDIQYSFGNTITEDVTIYARFVTPSDPEYAVTYVSDGEIVSTATTIGGMALNVPVPTKEGHEFIGWWVSDYEDASKLTYKYDEHVLGSDTTLYAVWDKANVSVTSSTITWPEKSATSNYKVEVKKGSTVIYTYNVTGGTTYAYDFTKLEAGDYVIDVTVGNETYTAYYKNKALNRVSGFEVIGGNVLVFDAVPNATNYYVTVDCGNDTHQHAYYNNGNKITYDFSDCSMQVGGIKFTVTATANGYASSVSKEFSYEANLAAATGVKVDEENATLTWNAVANADYYVVKIGNDETIVEGTSYSLKYYGAGEYTATVTAVAHGYNPAKAELTFTKTALSAPVDVTANGKTVTWTAVEGATGYKVKVNDTEFDVTDTTYTVEGVTSAVSVSVKAIKEGADSVYSDAVEISNVLGALNYNNGVVSWNSVVGASGFRVAVNGVTVGDVTTNYSEVTLTKKGENVITVTTMVGGRESADTQTVTVDAYEVTFNTNGGSNVNPAYLADGDTIKAVTATKYGYTLNSWCTTNNAENGQTIDLSTYKVTKDVTLYAKWDAKKITIALDVLNGNALEQTNVTVTFGEAFTLPVPTHEDELLTFAGWYAEMHAEGIKYTNELGESENVWSLDRENVTIVAGWINALSYTLVNQETAYSVSAGLDIEKLTTVTIPATYLGLPVTTVEGSAFRNCDKLVTINIPNTIQNVETGTAFLSCYSLMNINVYETDEIQVPDKNYYSIDGVLFYDNPNNEGKEIKSFPMARTGVYWIPEGIEVLPINVFRSASITELHVASTVVKIDMNAFSSHTIKKIVFENGAVGDEVHYLDIDENAFGYCSELISVVLPQRLRSFDSACLVNCYSLAAIDMVGEGEYYSAVDGVLMSADKSTIIYCPKAKPAYTIPSSVSVIGKGAFTGTKFTSMVIPANVTKIEENAFFECVFLTSLEFKGTNVADGALEIQTNAFGGCTGLTSITLPANLTVLAENAFANCSILQSVTVNCGNQVQFANNAFFDKKTGGSNIISLKLGKDFYCDNVGGVFGGPNMTTITADAESAYFFTENNVLYSKNADNPNNLSIQYYPAGLRITDFVPNENVTNIGDRVFEGRKTIKTVTIPAKVVSIGANAFKDCEGITSITFAPRTEDLTIGDYAFTNCKSLASITLPASLKTMGTYGTNGELDSVHVFDGCINLKAINVENGNTAFASADGILYARDGEGNATILVLCPAKNEETTVTIPATVTEIFDSAFKGNSTIEIINFEAETLDKEFALGRYAFAEMSALQTVNMPEGMEVIGIGTFMDSSIQSFVVPNSVNSLGYSSFKNTYALESLTFKADRTTGIALMDGGQIPPDGWPEGDPYGGGSPTSPDETNGVFIGSALTEIELPEDSTIGNYAFAWSNIEHFVVPEGTETIREAAFTNSKIQTIQFPDSLTTISDYAFENCRYLQAIELPKNCTYVGWSSFSGCRNVQTLDLGNVVEISEVAFDGLDNFEGELVIPNTVEYIGGGAFMQGGYTSVVFEDDDETSTRERLLIEPGFFGTFMYCMNIETVTFPNMNNGYIKITQDPDYPSAVFQMCWSLHTVTLGSGITTMTGLFAECDSLTTFNNLETNPSFLYENGIIYNKSKTEIIMAVGSDFTDTEFIIPDGIQIIHASAFENIDTLKSVYIPKSVKEIASRAFYGCSNLETVTFDPAYDQDIKFGDECFRADYDYSTGELIYTSKLTEIKLPKTVTTLSRYMFDGTAIAKIDKDTMPGVKEFGDNCFADCWNLTSVDLSYNTELRFPYSENFDTSVTVMGGSSPFSYCDKLTEVKLPEGLNCIPAYAFQNCVSLAEIDIPETVDEIAYGAFCNTALTKAILPDAIMYIGGTGDGSYTQGAFSNCPYLEEVVIGSSIFRIGGWDSSYAFANNPSLRKVTLKGNVQSVEYGTFFNCPNLTEFIITDDSGLEIVPAFFFENMQITSLHLPDSVTAIGEGAFKGCTLLTDITIPESVTAIGANAFQDCAISGEVYIPGTVMNIGEGAFAGTKNITDFVVDMTNPLYTSDEYGIIYDLANAIVAYPAGNARETLTIKEGVKDIRSYAFAGATLSQINIPEYVMTIGAGAFKGWKQDQTICFEVSMADSVHYGSAWRLGTKALKKYSNGAEVEPLGSWMSDDYSTDNFFDILNGLAEDGFYIALDLTYEPYPEWDPGWFETESYTYGRNGDYLETISSYGYYTIYDLTGLNTGLEYARYGGYLDEGLLTKYTSTLSPSDDPAETKQRIINFQGEELFAAMQMFTQFDEEMKKTEETFLGRECYKYSYVDGFEEYNFYFDKETGLCLKGRLLDNTSWEVTTFTIGYNIELPTDFEESNY